MIGRTNASNKISPNIEMVNISLLSNQISHQDLIGTIIILSYEDYNEEILWEGIEITRNIPANIEYTVTFGEVNGYKTPSSVTYAAVKGLSRSVKATYSSEFLTLNMTGTNTPVVTIKRVKEVGVSEKYKVVDYVETNGTQYIDTGFKPNQNTRVVVDFHANDVAKHVWGSRIEWRNNSFLCCWETNFDWCVQINASNFNGGTFDPNSRHTVEMSCTEFKVDDTTTATYSVDAFQCTNNLLIASVQSSEQSENFVGKYYSFKVYDGDNLVRDYVPVKNSQGVYGLYDRINDTFSSSTGSLAGGDYIYDETIATQTTVSGLHKIAYDTEYMIEASAVEGFTTPEVQYYTANQPSRNVSVDYLLAEERVTVNVSAEGGASVDGNVVKVSKVSSTNNIEEHLITNGLASFSVPYDETYTVSLSDMDGYTAPESQTYTASQPTREISMEYTKAVEHVIVNVSSDDNTDMDGYRVYVRFNVPNGVYIQDVDRNIYPEGTWDTMKVANGIAVVTDECSFVIALEDASNSFWDYMGTSTSLTTATSEEEAMLDYNGQGNTAKMIATASDGRNAAVLCSNYTFPNGQSGYLGAAGEWNAVAGLISDINELLSIVGETFSISTPYWTSTLSEDIAAWVMYTNPVNYNTLNVYSTCLVRAFTELFPSYIITNGKVEFDVPTGVEYKISVEDVDGYTTPEPQSFVADVGTRTVDMVYEAGKLGVFIATQAGDLINPNNWASSSGTAVGVAVCTENSKYIIGLSSQQVDTIRWATSTTTDKPNVPTSTNESEIITYYDGESYTTAMGRSTSDASGLVDMQSITFGGETLDGYLGSAGEWNDAINNYQAISAAFAKIGDSFMLSSSEVFWTSCEYSNYYAWSVLYDSYEGFEFENSAKTSYLAAVPFYKI